MDESKAGLYKCCAESNYGAAQSSAVIKYELNGCFFKSNKIILLINFYLENEKTERRKKNAPEKRKSKNSDQVVPEKQHVRIQEV